MFFHRINKGLIILLSLLSTFATANTESNNKITWYDGTIFTVEGKGWTNTQKPFDRLPLKAIKIVRPAVWELSRHSAGLSIRFITDANYIKVRWSLTDSNLAMKHMPATGVSGIDLYAKENNKKWSFVGNGQPTAKSNITTFNLPKNCEYLLYLPLYNGTEKIEIGLPSNNMISEASARKINNAIVFYGTSITQGACASRPGMATTAIVSRMLDVPVINLGFSGNGKMEIELANLLSELNPSIYVIDCLWNMNKDMVETRVEPFVKELRKHKPNTPIVLVENSYFKNTPTSNGNALRTVYEKLKSQKDSNLYFLPNTGLLGTDTEGTVDGCHPNDLGMMRQAKVFANFLKTIIEKEKTE